MNSEPLIPIWEAYLVAVEALKVSKRVVTFSNKAKQALHSLDDNEAEMSKRICFEKHKLGLNLLNRCTVIDQVTDLTLINSSKVIDDLFVLSLWATFERYLIDFFQVKGEKIREILPSDLAEVYYEHLSREIEYWKPMEILDLLKRSLFKGNEQLIELAKDILKYRNWVAHGRNLFMLKQG
ncbi:MAG: hypothetical protein DRR16_17595 [Candidatus Parabeggiatoa sp. nov. 3]|nr:MAG: hypothetical protein DRR00_02920 [Gammaproteobacteria bacterium]RKZ69158.1 MAG: hypothetical protein DRQ99_01740 [Gammaproteobacteria bacterium]RKZ83302.1 MAG: hypothetical protein DRR16_17595 [Gammaproteobacteria bacterium]